ncbi:MAG: hypothetical protein Q7N50_00835 [Armatimonadota bacterium]|nr:hypothetical protein [Armatimonadota bacterium]
MKTKFAVLCILISSVIGALAALAILPAARQSDRQPIVGAELISVAWAAELKATARAVNIAGETVGEVSVNDQPVIRIRTSAAGLSPVERAEIVARRLNELAPSIKPSDIRTAEIRGQIGVLAGDELIITADLAHAAINDTTRYGLANQWRSNLTAAISGQAVAGVTSGPVPAATGPQVQGRAVRIENQVQKGVPIISVGSGLRVGVALVTGPSSQVDKVNAVAQVEAQFQRVARIRAYIPVETESITELHRVPETSIRGLADIKL